ncbi:MAG TPA: sugar phosphate isomerase/epimerase, partial [Armatimonadota bacterium]|nr:sugar phosphate isomerase/epimerase [Armatimonadota bacterium]
MNNIDRRHFLGTSAVGAAAFLAGNSLAADGKRPKLGVQLYSVRDIAAKDLPGVLKSIAKMGYEGVEFAGYYGHSAEDLKLMLDDNGLVAAGAHVGIDTLTGDRFIESLKFHRKIGNRFPIVPGLPGNYTNTPDAWKSTADLFNAIAATLKQFGMRTGYHNHTHEFHAFDNGEVPWDIFFGNTVDDVIMQFDTGNAMHADAGALPFLEKYPGRAASIHCKEFSTTNDKALLGEGEVPWKDLFAIADEQDATEWYF